jgi:hypothetical protein
MTYIISAICQVDAAQKCDKTSKTRFLYEINGTIMKELRYFCYSWKKAIVTKVIYFP